MMKSNPVGAGNKDERGLPIFVSTARAAPIVNSFLSGYLPGF
ncbi:MAG: hypothetical protein R2806_04185 [Saprospiraceae bacterium]